MNNIVLIEIIFHILHTIKSYVGYKMYIFTELFDRMIIQNLLISDKKDIHFSLLIDFNLLKSFG